MIKNKCDTCRNCFQDCQSDPVFITDEEASVEGVPADLVKECDCYVPEDDGSILEDEDEDDFDFDDDILTDEDLLDDDDFEGDEDLAERDPTWDDDE